MPGSRFARASAALALALVAPLILARPLYAQGNGNGNKNNKGNGNGSGHQSSPPSSSPLPNPSAGPAAGAVTPLAWLDDATVLTPGSASLTISTARWSGADLSEFDFPIVEAAVGLAPRFQIGASVPHIVGSADGTGPIGGMGTSYIASKIALLTSRSGVKLAASPVLEVLGDNAVQALPAGANRTRFGLPVNIEIPQGAARLFASGGFFSQGVWFAGGGLSVQATPRVGATVSITRSWANDTATGVIRDRRELSGSSSFFLTPNLAVYGALGRTIATSDDNGAGTTISGGLSILFSGSVRK